MQIHAKLDIRESPWEFSPEAQTHNKLLLTGTVFLFPVFTRKNRRRFPVFSCFFPGGFGGSELRGEREKRDFL